MANNNIPPEIDDDDDFRDIYKEYTGPSVANVTYVQEEKRTIPRSSLGSEERDDFLDPNAVPTGFTSRQAKARKDKLIAEERKKKEEKEAFTCRLCGRSGHFAQGCPSTLGKNGRSKDFFQRVPARDKRVRERFTEELIDSIEKDIGCKIKMEEKFLIVSGKESLVLAKGIDAVHKVINGEGSAKVSPSSRRSRLRSRERSPLGSRIQRS